MRRRAPWQLRAMALLFLVCCCGGPDPAPTVSDAGAGNVTEPGTPSCSLVNGYLECKIIGRR